MTVFSLGVGLYFFNHLPGLTLAALLLLLAGSLILFQRSRRQNKKIREQFRQLTELNEALDAKHQRLLALMEEKRNLISLLTHDIRTPLSLIRLNTASLWSRRQAFSAEQQTEIREIEEAANRIEKMSLRILEVEQLLKKEIYANLEWIRLDDLLEPLIREFALYAGKKSIRLENQFPSAIPLILADAFFMKRVIGNLLDNAIKFSPAHSTVRLRYRTSPDGAVFLEIEDQGPGLSAPQQERIFQAPSSLSFSPTREKSGLGYGLFLSKRLMEAMGGAIEVSSAPGRGATFIVRLQSQLPGERAPVDQPASAAS